MKTQDIPQVLAAVPDRRTRIARLRGEQAAHVEK